MTNQAGRTAFVVATGVVALVVADAMLAAAAPRAPAEPERVPLSIFARGPDGGILMGAPTAMPDGGAGDPAPPASAARSTRRSSAASSAGTSTT